MSTRDLEDVLRESGLTVRPVYHSHGIDEVSVDDGDVKLSGECNIGELARALAHYFEQKAVTR